MASVHLTYHAVDILHMLETKQMELISPALLDRFSVSILHDSICLNLLSNRHINVWFIPRLHFYSCRSAPVKNYVSVVEVVLIKHTQESQSSFHHFTGEVNYSF